MSSHPLSPWRCLCLIVMAAVLAANVEAGSSRSGSRKSSSGGSKRSVSSRGFSKSASRSRSYRSSSPRSSSRRSSVSRSSISRSTRSRSSRPAVRSKNALPGPSIPAFRSARPLSLDRSARPGVTRSSRSYHPRTFTKQPAGARAPSASSKSQGRLPTPGTVRSSGAGSRKNYSPAQGRAYSPPPNRSSGPGDTPGPEVRAPSSNGTVERSARTGYPTGGGSPAASSTKVFLIPRGSNKRGSAPGSGGALVQPPAQGVRTPGQVHASSKSYRRRGPGGPATAARKSYGSYVRGSHLPSAGKSYGSLVRSGGFSSWRKSHYYGCDCGGCVPSWRKSYYGYPYACAGNYRPGHVRVRRHHGWWLSIGFGFHRAYPSYYYSACPSYCYAPYPYYCYDPYPVYCPYPSCFTRTQVIYRPVYEREVVVESDEGLYPEPLDEAPAAYPGPGSRERRGEDLVTVPAPGADREAAGMSAEQMHQSMLEGVERFAQGKYEDAAGLFLRVATADPDNVDAVLAYACARFAAGDYSGSATAVRRGVRRTPDVVNSVFDIRDRYSRMVDFDQHLAALEDFVRERPGDIDGWIVLGFVRHFIGQRELATRTFEVVKRLSQENADVADIFLSAEPLEELEPPQEPHQSAPANNPGEDGGEAASVPATDVSAGPWNGTAAAARQRPVPLEPAYEIPSPQPR